MSYETRVMPDHYIGHVEESFSDILYDWMERAPWLGISLGLHFVAYMILVAIPWSTNTPEATQIIEAHFPEPVDPPEDPPIPPDEDIVEPDEIDPEITEIAPDEITETVDSPDNMDTMGDPEFNSDAAFDAIADNSIIGIGGPPGGKFGTRGDGSGKIRQAGQDTVESIQEGLAWLADNQSPDGSWDVDEFYANNVKGGTNCTEGSGIASQDIGVTGLALLAFLGDGSTTRDGEYRSVVQRGIKWLGEQQDPDTGLIGVPVGHAYVYDHAIASLAMAENFYDSRNPFQKLQVQKAMNFIGRARHPYGGWRYEVPSDGDSDTSITGWMVFALKAGEDAGLKVDREAYNGALQWIDSVSDAENGRIGYIGPGVGGRSSRVTGANDHFGPEKGEAMTGVGLLSRVFLGQTPQTEPMMKKHGDLMLRSLPEWNESDQSIDMYYWYYGTYAMYQLGGEHWRRWRKGMERAILPHQRQDGDYLGSWDPVGAWGYQGGRVYSTALMVLTLEVFYRYSPLLGAR
ncbi:MAG: terpene cyclase/mutase family protein [Planctomycetota bacterium]|nr:terpene cyclase/mutase family protein [Planctomycetota bacterium]